MSKKTMQHMTDTEILKEDAKGYKPVWDGRYNCYVYADHYDNSLACSASTYRDHGDQIWFASTDDADASIKKHRDVWLRYFGVEPEVSEMTVSDIEKLVGHKVKIVKEEK